MHFDTKNQQVKTSDGATRRAYATPTIKEFGPVGALTQSGTQPMMESTGSPERVLP
jgi:hypothetical protein